MSERYYKSMIFNNRIFIFEGNRRTVFIYYLGENVIHITKWTLFLLFIINKFPLSKITTVFIHFLCITCVTQGLIVVNCRFSTFISWKDVVNLQEFLTCRNST